MANEKVKVKFIDKLHNFRNQTILFAIGWFLTALFTILFLLFFQIDRMYMGSIDAETFASIHLDNQVLGFVMFMFAVTTIVIGVLEVYNAVPYIQKKDKLSVKKWFAGLTLAEAVLSLTMMAFAIVNVFYVGTYRFVKDGTEQWGNYSGTPYFWIPVAVLFFLVAIYNVIVFFPTLSVKTYLPEVVHVEKKK